MKVIPIIFQFFFLQLFVIIFLGWFPQENFNSLMILMRDFVYQGFNMVGILTLVCAAIPIAMLVSSLQSACYDIAHTYNPTMGPHDVTCNGIGNDPIHMLAFWYLKHKGFVTGNPYRYNLTIKLFNHLQEQWEKSNPSNAQ